MKRRRRSRGVKLNTVQYTVLGVLSVGRQEGCEITVERWNRVCRTVFHVLQALGYCEKIERLKYRWTGASGFRRLWESHEMLFGTTKNQMRRLTHASMCVIQRYFIPMNCAWTFPEFEREIATHTKSTIPQRRLYDALNVFIHMGLVRREGARAYVWHGLN